MERILLAIAAAAVLFAAGCSTPPPPPQEPPPLPEPEPEPEPEPPYFPTVNILSSTETVAPPKAVEWKMVEMDAVFSSALAVLQVSDSRTKDGFKNVHVHLKNLSALPVTAAYRFDWSGPDGVRVVDPYHDTWETKTFLPGDEEAISSIAPRRNCEDFKLRFRAVQ